MNPFTTVQRKKALVWLSLFHLLVIHIVTFLCPSCFIPMKESGAERWGEGTQLKTAAAYGQDWKKVRSFLSHFNKTALVYPHFASTQARLTFARWGEGTQLKTAA
jgi:hypothetical protein